MWPGSTLHMLQCRLVSMPQSQPPPLPHPHSQSVAAPGHGGHHDTGIIFIRKITLISFRKCWFETSFEFSMDDGKGEKDSRHFFSILWLMVRSYNLIFGVFFSPCWGLETLKGKKEFMIRKWLCSSEYFYFLFFLESTASLSAVLRS